VAESAKIRRIEASSRLEVFSVPFQSTVKSLDLPFSFGSTPNPQLNILVDTRIELLNSCQDNAKAREQGEDHPGHSGKT
jgi:hypothetical protein